jgi:exosome complex RNA-binding protein Csl4
MSFGRDNSNVTNSYLRGPDGIVSNQSGQTLDRDAYIVGIGASTNGAETWTAQVRIGGSTVASLSIAASASGYRNDLSVSVNAGDVIQAYCSGTNIDRPIVTVFFKER